MEHINAKLTEARQLIAAAPTIDAKEGYEALAPDEMRTTGEALINGVLSAKRAITRGNPAVFEIGYRNDGELSRAEDIFAELGSPNTPVQEELASDARGLHDLSSRAFAKIVTAITIFQEMEAKLGVITNEFRSYTGNYQLGMAAAKKAVELQAPLVEKIDAYLATLNNPPTE